MKMQCAAHMTLFCLAAWVSPVAASQLAVAPVQKVVDMLKEMKSKGEQMMATEKATYATYSKWVSVREKDLGFEVTTAKRQIEEHVAFIERTDSNIGELAAKVKSLDGEIAQMEGEKKDATASREAEHLEFSTLEADLSESVDALERAIQVLSAQAYSRPQAEALLQKMAKTDSGMRRVLVAFLQLADQGAARAGERSDGAPAVAAYAFQAGGVLEILEKMLSKFKAELDDTLTAESNKDHAYQLEVLHLTSALERTTAEREEKAAVKAQASASSAKAKGALAETRAGLAEDEKFLADMKATFKAKSATFEANQQVRKEELEAVAKAIEIISGSAVAGSYREHVKLVQRPAPAFLQTAASKLRGSARQRAAELLRRRARELSSRTLAQAVEAVSANPFAKVIDMIENLLAKLKEEATAEATHKEWCDGQLQANKLKREKKSATVDRLAAEVEVLDASVTEMGRDIATVIKEQSELTESMGEASKQRAAEKATNLETIADAKAGIAAVKQALVILREFYSSQTSFVQASGSQVPEMQEYKGMHAEKTGVIGMLEVIQSDFARLEADTTANEALAARSYATFMSEAKADKLQKHETEVSTKLRKDQTEFERSGVKKDFEAVSKELEEASKYHDVLKSSCLAVHVSYEERVARRKEEIEALKQAYAILNEKTDM